MKIVSFLILLFAVTVSLYADDYEACVENALRTKQYDAGIQCLRQAETNSPKSYRIAYLFGEVFMAAGKYDSADVHFQRAIELKDDYVDAFQGLGKSYYEQKQFVKAIGAFNNAIKYQGHSPSAIALYDLGIAYAAADSFKQGTLYLSKAVEMDKSNTDAVLALGDLYSKGGVFILAKEQYETALRMDPKSVITHRKLAQAFDRNGETDSAIAEYNKVLAIDSNNIDVLQDLGSIYVEGRRWKDAYVVYDKLSRLDSKNFDNIWNTAICAYKAASKASDYSEAIPPLKKIVAEKTDTFAIKAMEMLGQCYVYTKDYKSAVDTYKNMISKDSSSVTANDWKFYGSALLSNKDTTEALSALEKFTLMDSTDCDIMKIMGPEKMRQKKYDEAIKFFELRIARKCDAGNAILPTMKNIGLCYHALTQFDSALVWYRRVLSYQSSDAYSIL
ncbi:MAG TPA: tetratricopeptide repeat protein, partial [Candidatus Kapabacteria bacterium]|nr:tetratricopeptide repeat protein [Candidatus Kapabacteria bacterium]